MVAWKDTIGILTRDSRNIFPSFVKDAYIIMWKRMRE